MERTGTARWTGDLKAGNGTFKVGSGAVDGKYSFATRFENAPGTNPEELIAAAHAACYSMALSNELSKAGHIPRSVATTATVTLGMVGAGFEITGILLDCAVDVADVDAPALLKTAQGAKTNCPVSKALAAVPITLRLNGHAA
jgi:osmotically inducible protein OsmC